MSKYKVGDKFILEITGTENRGVTQIQHRNNFNPLRFYEERFYDTLDRIDSDYINEHFGELQDEAYSKGVFDGRNDVWEFVKKCWNMSVLDTREIFGYEYVKGILDNFTPQEALAKLKAYEDSKIEVGDVVFCFADCDESWRENEEHYGVLLEIVNDIYTVLMKNGDVSEFAKNSLEKTGKYIDISSILEQIGE